MSKIKKLWFILENKEKKNIYFLMIMMVFGMLLELIGISSIIPLIIIIFDQNYLTKLSFINNLYLFQNLNFDNLIIIFFSITILIYFFKFLYLSLLYWKLNKFIFDLNANLSERLLKIYINMDFLSHIQRNSSELISNIIIEANKYSQQVVGPLLRILSELIVFIGIIALLFYFEPIGTSITIIIFFFFSLIFVLLSSNYLGSWGTARIINEKLRIKHTQQGIEGIKEIKIDNAEDQFIKKFSLPNILSLRAQAKHTTLLEIPRVGIELIALISIIIIIYLVYSNSNNNFSELLIIVGIFSASTLRILPSINKIIVAFQNLRFGIPVIEKLYEEILKKNKQEYSEKTNNILFNNNINLKNLYFKYPNREKNIIENLNLEIKKGKSIGIFGDSGSGKSTLISLIVGLIKPDKGEILIDNINIQNNLQSWRQSISFVSQRVFLLDDTIKNNILFGNKDFNEEIFFNSLNAARLENFIETLPEGINTNIGERGVLLSGGQIQRIGIARALYKKPKLLILDESTNALDQETEIKLINDVHKLSDKCNIIIISHKMSTLKKCDFIYKIENKEIVKL